LSFYLFAYANYISIFLSLIFNLNKSNITKMTERTKPDSKTQQTPPEGAVVKTREEIIGAAAQARMAGDGELENKLLSSRHLRQETVEQKNNS
jgi:hypothetical protein